MLTSHPCRAPSLFPLFAFINIVGVTAQDRSVPTPSSHVVFAAFAPVLTASSMMIDREFALSTLDGMTRSYWRHFCLLQSQASPNFADETFHTDTAWLIFWCYT